MSALGRLSAAIAHEIRQPLTAIAGSVKELARLAPLSEDERHLVEIVGRESERLNLLITEFLAYSREKTYEFCEADISGILDETLTLFEKHPQMNGKYKIAKRLAGQPVRARVDSNRLKQVFWNLCDNALRAMPTGGTLTVGVETAPFLVAFVSKTRASAWIPSSAKRFSNLCSQVSRVAPDSVSQSCIKSSRLTVEESASLLN